jgi:aspartate/glutamate racemase
MSDGKQTSVRKFGVVGGLGPLASADVFFKLIKSMPAASDGEHFGAIFEQHSGVPMQAVRRCREESCTSSICLTASRSAA